MRPEYLEKSSGILRRAMAVSIFLHAIGLWWLVPEFSTDVTLVPPGRMLQSRLLPVPAPEGASIQTNVAANPRKALPPSIQARSEPGLLAGTSAETAVAVPPAPTFAPPPVAASPGGVPAMPVAHQPATAALADAQHDKAPDAAGLRQYRLALAGEARRFKRYPELARREGLSGTAEVRVAVAPGQRLAELSRSSGHAVLDAAALEMLRLAAARAQLPESLRDRQFAVLLPVVFEVDE